MSSGSCIPGNGRIALTVAALFWLERCQLCFNTYEIDPAKIKLCLVRIEAGSEDSDLFRLASLTWSVPVSAGYGRRLRYLVWDEHHGKLAGIIALGDPVFNLSVRDNLIGWNSDDRSKRLVNILDAYVLGAVPPYNMLLVGKAVACLVRSREVYDDFAAAYGGSVGLISGRRKRANAGCQDGVQVIPD
jgi:hypothetical protein